MTLEEEAKEFGSNPRNVAARLRETIAVLNTPARQDFTMRRFDLANKRILSNDGSYCLQWQTRKYPHSPISYRNQQTSVGTVLIHSTLNPVRKET